MSTGQAAPDAIRARAARRSSAVVHSTPLPVRWRMSPASASGRPTKRIRRPQRQELEELAGQTAARPRLGGGDRLHHQVGGRPRGLGRDLGEWHRRAQLKLAGDVERARPGQNLRFELGRAERAHDDPERRPADRLQQTADRGDLTVIEAPGIVKEGPRRQAGRCGQVGADEQRPGQSRCRRHGSDGRRRPATSPPRTC